MTKNVFLFALVGLLTSTTFSQSTNEEEESLNMIQDHALIIPINTNNWNYGFVNSSNNFELNLDISFNSNSNLEYLESNSSDSIHGEISNSFTYENDIYQIIGEYDFTKKGVGNLTLGTQNYTNAKLSKLVETYIVQMDTIVYCNFICEYYTFFDNSGHKIFEVFKKQRGFYDSQIGEERIGISYNINDITNGQNLSLNCSPNPAIDNTNVSFELPNDGNVSVKISNSSSSINHTIFQGNLSKGLNVIPIYLYNTPTVSYSISVVYNNQQYSTNLIKQ